MMTQHGDVAWGLIASMYVGNIMLLAQNILLVPLFIWLLRGAPGDARHCRVDLCDRCLQH